MDTWKVEEGKLSDIWKNYNEEKLELFYSDVWGPTTTQSIGGKQYFVTFIDDHSRKVWIYLLKYKSEVFEAFRR